MQFAYERAQKPPIKPVREAKEVAGRASTGHVWLHVVHPLAILKYLLAFLCLHHAL